jgi:hypothetical protein
MSKLLDVALNRIEKYKDVKNGQNRKKIQKKKKKKKKK